MKLTVLRTAITAGVLAVAGTAAAVALTAAPASAGASAARATSVVVVNACSGAAQVKPSRVYGQGCNPSQQYFTGLSWVSWKSVAYGSGTLKVNSCNPNCATGKYISYPVLTAAWRAEARPGHAGQRYFSRLTFIFTGKRPHGAAAQTSTLASHGG